MLTQHLLVSLIDGTRRTKHEADVYSDVYSNSSDNRVVVIFLLNYVVITCVVEGV